MSRRSSWIAATVLALLLSGCQERSVAAAAPERPGRLVDLDDGRKLNLRCSGRGSPTVILESGFGADSTAWFKVQPTIARTTRVCAYDRAGYGFSDPGPTPRDGAAIVRDLDQALRKAGEKGPFIVVGHSAGGLYGRLFAAQRPRDVAGLVLLDPTFERRAQGSQQDGLEGVRRRLVRCLAATQASAPPEPAQLRALACVSKRTTARGVASAQQPAVWNNQLSELNEIFGRSSEQVMRTGAVLNGVPTFVITASATAISSRYTPPGADSFISVVEIQHQTLASAHTYGWQRTVFSSHLVMIDRPEVAIAAIAEMVAAARDHRPPAPLPPSEQEPPAASGGLSDLLPPPPAGLADVLRPNEGASPK